MLRAISCVAVPCCSTATEIVLVIWLIWAMVPVMAPIDATASLVDACMAATCAEISSVALAVWLASAFTSDATTAKPRPDLAGACGLDGRVQRQQIGLGGDAVDQLHHFADLLGAARQDLNGGIGALGIAYRLAGDLAGSRLPDAALHRLTLTPPQPPQPC